MGTAFNLSRWIAKGRLLLGVPGEATALLDYDKRKIRMGVSSAVEYHTRLHSCKKEPETVAWIEGFSPGDVFYDVGANVGAYSLVASAFWEGAVRVVAIEPGISNFPRLVRNLALNHLEQWVTPLPVALAEQTGMADLHYADLTPGGALHSLNSTRDFRNRPFDSALSCPVLAFELDRLIELFGLPQPTHLKLDVDGTELEILRGATRTLRSVRSLLVEMETDHPQGPHLLALLEQNGFKATSRHPYRYRKEQPKFSGISNVIFSRTRAEAAVRS